MAAPAVLFDEGSFTNQRGMRLNTCRWVPAEQAVKGLVFLCHGYGQDCTVYTAETGRRLARAGYGVHGIDYEGHGKSEGLRGFVPRFSDLVTDCAALFTSIMERAENAGLPTFLLGESMGGAVSLLISQRDPARFRGLVLVAPMLKISNKVLPPRFLIFLLLHLVIQLGKLIPTWKLVPNEDLYGKAFKDPTFVLSNPYMYRGKHRVKTALELFLTSQFVWKHLAEVSAPFLCVHGTDDAVNEAEASQALYDSAISFDKTLKLYPGMWHGLTTGEPEHNVDLVLQDITRWLDERSGPAPCSPKLRSGSLDPFADGPKAPELGPKEATS